jgi:hypothetical protein
MKNKLFILISKGHKEKERNRVERELEREREREGEREISKFYVDMLNYSKEGEQ